MIDFFLDKTSIQDVNTIRLFCKLYEKYRDFALAKSIAKHEPMKYKEAESLSNFINQLLSIVKTKPQEFISNEDEKSNVAIDNYMEVKQCLINIENEVGKKMTNQLYKAVKFFFSKRYFAYQMDQYFTFFIQGLYLFRIGDIPMERFLFVYCHIYSLFDGSQKFINFEHTNHIYNKIYDVIKKFE